MPWLHRISDKTVSNRLRDAGIRPRKSALEPILAQQHRQLCRKCCDNQHDNARPHAAMLIAAFLAQNNIQIQQQLRHPTEQKPTSTIATDSSIIVIWVARGVQEHSQACYT